MKEKNIWWALAREMKIINIIQRGRKDDDLIVLLRSILFYSSRREAGTGERERERERGGERERERETERDRHLVLSVDVTRVFIQELT